MKIALIVGGAAVLLLVALIAAGSDHRSPADRIAESCLQEYGDRGSLAVDECKLRLSLRYLADREKAKENSAYDKVR